MDWVVASAAASHMQAELEGNSREDVIRVDVVDEELRDGELATVVGGDLRDDVGACCDDFAVDGVDA